LPNAKRKSCEAQTARARPSLFCVDRQDLAPFVVTAGSASCVRRHRAAALWAFIKLRRLPTVGCFARAQSHFRCFAFGDSHKSGSCKQRNVEKQPATLNLPTMTWPAAMRTQRRMDSCQACLRGRVPSQNSGTKSGRSGGKTDIAEQKYSSRSGKGLPDLDSVVPVALERPQPPISGGCDH
jgi:hypothetical protein